MQKMKVSDVLVGVIPYSPLLRCTPSNFSKRMKQIPNIVYVLLLAEKLTH